MFMQKNQELPPSPLAHMFAEESNTLCFHCKRPSKQWTDLAHGIFLCLNCAAMFKELVWVTRVKSVGLDDWTALQVEQMERGGNDKFKKFLAIYGLQNAQIRTIVTSKAAVYYRGLIEGKQMGVEPSPEVGRELYKEQIPITDMSPEELFETAKEKAYYIGSKTKSLGEKGIKKLQEKYESGELKQGAIKVATTVSTGAQWLWGALKNKASEIAEDIKK